MECAREKDGVANRQALFAAMVTLCCLDSVFGDEVIGRVTGSVDVTATGAATYTIPIEVPAAANGLAPEINLRYHSQSLEGLAGFGWSLSGFSKIARCKSTVAVDGEFRGVRYDTKDRLCLDGDPLIRINDTEYRTEIHNYERITAFGSISSASPRYFRVELPTGRVLIYGNDEGEDDATVRTSGTAEVRAWLLKRVIDPYDNRVDFVYFLDAVSGEHHPLGIAWSSNPKQGTVAQYRLTFEYTDRRDACADAACPDVRSGYIFGTPWVHGHRLKRIAYSYAGQQVHDWALEYLDATESGRSVLRSVRQCGYQDGTIDCLPPTIFEANDTAVGWRNIDSKLFPPVSAIGADTGQVGDVDADGRHELFWLDPATNQLHVFYRDPSGYLAGVALPHFVADGGFLTTLDVDGDGDSDFLSDDGTSWVIGESSGAGVPEYSTVRLDGLTGDGVHAIDVNRDGKDDVLLRCPHDISSFCVRLNTSPYGVFSAEYDARLPRLEGAASSHWAQFIRHARKHVRYVDFDGDGRHDILVPAGNPASITATAVWQAHQSSGFEFEEDAMGSFTGVEVVTLDANGDGLSDVAYSNGTWRVRLSTGNGFSEESDTGIPAQFGAIPVIVDYESDGRDDLLLPINDRWRVYPSNGKTFSASRWIDSGAPSPVDAPWILPANIRGSGESDLYVARADMNKWTWDFHLGAGDKDLLRTVIDGLGNKTTVFYASMTDISTAHGQGASTKARLLNRVPTKVVSRLRGDDGIGGTYDRTYTYRGAKIDLTGRGFLGFSQIDENDSRNEATTTSFDQRFPYIGRMISKVTWQSTARQKLRSRTISAYSVDTQASMDGDAARDFHFVYPVQRTVTDFDQGAVPLRTLTTTGSNFDFDHGVARTITSELDSPQWAGVHTRIQTVDLDDGGLAARYCLRMPTYIDVTSIKPDGGSDNRAIRFTNNATRCDVSSRTSSPQGSSPLTTSYSHDGFGNVIHQQSFDANAPAEPREIRWTYDTQGYREVAQRKLISRTLGSCGNASASTWDATASTWNYALGREASRTAVNGLTTTRTYDDFGRLRQVQSIADGKFVDIVYRPCAGYCPDNGRYEVAVTYSDGRSSEFVYDAYGRRIGWTYSLFDGREGRISTVFDEFGRVSHQSVPFIEGQPEFRVEYSYDALNRVKTVNRPISEAEPSGAVTEFLYDGLFVSEINPKGHVTIRRYLPTGNLANVTDAMGGVTRYAYNSFGQLTYIVDPGGSARTFLYDDKGLMVRAEDPDSGAWSFEYNAYGQMISRTDDKHVGEAGRALFVYDLSGRLISRRDLVGGVDAGRTDWSYYGSGAGRGRLQRVSASESGYREVYRYNSLGLLARTETTISANTYVTDWEYDNERRLDTATYPETSAGNRPAFRYLYNGQGYLSEVREVTGGIDQPIYTVNARDDVFGRVTEATFGFGSGAYPERHHYDAATQSLTSINTGIDGGVQNRSYTWDILGNLVTRAAMDRPGSPIEAVSLDRLNRLTSAFTTNALGLSESTSLSYDAAGNIRSKSDFGGLYHYAGNSGPHAVDSITTGETDTVALSYDANGNTTGIDDASIAWTPFNKPRQIIRNGTTSTFGYGPNRQRITQDSGDRHITYVGPHFEVDIDDTGTTFRSRVFVNGRLIFVQKENVDEPSARGFYVHQDYRGSIDSLVQAYGSETSEVVRLAFDAFGRRRNLDWSADSEGERAADAHVVELGYTGHEHLDGVGLIHMNGRIQDPAIGRMLSPDPVYGIAGEPQSHNPYSYVHNNPSTLMDPTGYRPRRKLRGGAWTVYYPNGSPSGDFGRDSGRRHDAWSPFWVQDAQGDRFCVGCRRQYANEDWVSIVTPQQLDPTTENSPRPDDGWIATGKAEYQPPAAGDVLGAWLDDIDADIRNSTSVAFILAFGIGIQGSLEMDIDLDDGSGALMLSPEFVVAGIGASVAFEPSVEGSVSVGPPAGSPFPVNGTLCVTGACGSLTLFDERLAKISARGGMILGTAATYSVQLPSVNLPLVISPTIVPLRGIPLF